MSIARAGRRVANLLKASQRKVVFAESCTGGLVCAALTRTPGITQYLCGGMVTYRSETKTAYLKIPKTVLDDPGPVSREVAARMARSVLRRTPEADVATSVTGHLGPNAPPELDGVVYVGIAFRQPASVVVRKLTCHPRDRRGERQRWVVEQVLKLLAKKLQA